MNKSPVNLSTLTLGGKVALQHRVKSKSKAIPVTGHEGP
jgi:hypothetical protein